VPNVEPAGPLPALPVARVALDVSLDHLDRPFDYAVTPQQDLTAVPGARVRARFAGRLRDGFVLERLAASDHEGPLTPLHRVVSAEPVLTPEMAALVRSVADHYAGTFADVVRLAVPPRHAATEDAAPGRVEDPVALDGRASPLDHYPTGASLLDAIRAGHGPRTAWQVVPTAGSLGDWAGGLASAARACADSGRGSVVVVSDHRALARLAEACTEWLGPSQFAVLTAEAGPAERYRAYLRALRGEVMVVIGNRAATFAPVAKLGLVAVFDDGDDSLAEQRAPYPHARDVLALRADQAGAGVLFAGYGRTAEVQWWVERGWLRELVADRPSVRHAAPLVRVSADSDRALARDPAARQARLPHEAFELIRSALPQGPVLVQVPRAGYLMALVCQDCREPARCSHCGGPLRQARPTRDGSGQEFAQLSCSWCGRPEAAWRCQICGGGWVRAPIVGAERTAEELGKAFPRTVLRRSSGGRRLAAVTDSSAIVVATPGSEPPADGGYAAAILLDTGLLLLRPDLRAGEEALRRWLNATALVRPGADGGSVLAVGDSAGRALQALVRVDPAGFAERELTERGEARFPPAVTMIVVEGPEAAVAELMGLLDLPRESDLLGPVPPVDPGPDPPSPYRLLLRAPRPIRDALVRAVKGALGVRSARKSEGALRVRVDPVVIG
jgi:primosomal protein N' (replication factor Y)